MDSQLVKALKFKMQPVAVILTNDKPAEGLHFKEGSMNGCVAAMLTAVSRKNRLGYFDRNSFGCPGGGTGLGFGDRYGRFPIDCLLSTGNREAAAMMGSAGAIMAEGERFYKSPELARKWVNTLPFTDVPAEYVVFKPWALLTEQDEPALIIFFANADQLSALIVLSDYNRGTNQSITAPFGAACQSILFGYAEAEKDQPRGVIGFFDIAQRLAVDRETLSFTVPYKMFREMEASVPGSFLETHAWQKIQERL
ncbi:hypothetical protein SPSYN_01090 [Sporotomaculum syntrophicum]|uniref:DUF169 domain-containing protein n=1 Tax=Sporotomaculum syntrophicum TaxID=182264 RepID=A0A9D2WPB3_9FIRM|nr:DUF169 domain-containing protein [Sporotomaculum syntrophicum]KAF1084954.1 hypothetical protein SPSYN_01090 [Sporotomaculum syntrophicum]